MMSAPKYYFSVNPSSQCPRFDALSVNAYSYDVYVGSYPDIKSQLLGQVRMSAATYDNEHKVMQHFQKHFGPDKPVSFYRADAGTIYTLQNRGDGNYAVMKEYSVDAASEGEDDGSRSSPITLSIPSKKSTIPAAGFLISPPKKESAFPLAENSARYAQNHGLFQFKTERPSASVATHQTERLIGRSGEQRRAR